MTPEPKFKVDQEVEVIETGGRGFITEVNPSQTGIYVKPLDNEEVEEIVFYRIAMENRSIVIHPETSLKAI